MTVPVLQLDDIVVTYGAGPFGAQASTPSSMSASRSPRAKHWEVAGRVRLGEDDARPRLSRPAAADPWRDALWRRAICLPAGRCRGQLSVVLQHPEWALNPRLRCGRSVEEPLALRGAPASERSERVKAI